MRLYGLEVDGSDNDYFTNGRDRIPTVAVVPSSQHRDNGAPA